MKFYILCFLLSALGSPGAAHLYLKRVTTGVIFFLCFWLPFAFVIEFGWQQIKMVYHALFAYKVEPTFSAMFFYMFENFADESQIPFVKKAAWLSLFVWVLALCDTMRLCMTKNSSN